MNASDASRATDIAREIKEINQLFIKIQEIVKNKAPKAYSKELIELLFEQPYCKMNI